MCNILIVNHSQENCGVYQYGKRAAQIFKASRKYNVIYSEPDSETRLLSLIAAVDPVIIIYNYLAQTMSWLTHPGIERIRALGIEQGLIVHNIGYAQIFDFYLHQNPRHPQVGPNFPLLRPLFQYPEIPSGHAWGYCGPDRIGTFGFALPEKNYASIVQFINSQFDEAVIKMHLTAAHFRPDQGWLEMIRSECDRQITKPGVTLEITSDFRGDDAILDFLTGNDLNVFLYQHFPHYNGISSVIDYALSVRKPIAVCKSGLFSHINDVTPSICVEDSTLPEIMQRGFEPLQRFHDEWSNSNFVRHLEEILDSL